MNLPFRCNKCSDTPSCVALGAPGKLGEGLLGVQWRRGGRRAAEGGTFIFSHTSRTTLRRFSFVLLSTSSQDFLVSSRVTTAPRRRFFVCGAYRTGGQKDAQQQETAKKLCVLSTIHINMTEFKWNVPCNYLLLCFISPSESRIQFCLTGFMDKVDGRRSGFGVFSAQKC